MADTLILPMLVLADHLKTPLRVPSLNPNYKTALRSYLGKYATPAAFNSDLLLQKGVHLHFVLPSAMKKGSEMKNQRGETVLDYPAVPDRFLVTRMYVKDHQIETDCHLVESNFYSLDSAYTDSITIPKFDDLRARHRFRYLGRTYPADKPAPEPVGESGYFEKITALGAGDPVFSAYYPSCSSVFGFYDSLKGVPPDAVLTYFVIGYYADDKNDLFYGVETAGDMRQRLAQYDLSVESGNTDICSRCVLFGEVGGINLAAEEPVPLGEINVGIGKSSAEALSAIISRRNGQGDPALERFLTAIQYDTADEASQPDGNFKIDDDLHLRGFTQMDPMEKTYSVKLPKDWKDDAAADLANAYADLTASARELGQLRRKLEYKKNALYSLWEVYEDASPEKEKTVMAYLDPLAQEISGLRADIRAKADAQEERGKALKARLREHNADLEETAPEPFYLPKDPAVMLFGDGMNRTYAFGEDGRFTQDNTLLCLTGPLTPDTPEAHILACFRALPDLSPLCPDYKAYALSALLLDTINLQPRLGLNLTGKEKGSPLLFNGNPEEKVTLLMQWQSMFYPDYTGSDPRDSRFVYGDTDYTYFGKQTDNRILCEGTAVLTPHGVYQLQEKLQKYLKNHSDSPEAAAAADRIRDLAAVSQSLGGFQISLSGFQYVFQYPMDIDPKDDYSKSLAQCLDPQEPEAGEPAAQRLAVRDGAQIYPLREGFFDLAKLALVTSFGEQRKIIDDDLVFQGTRYISENLQLADNGLCFFPLALSSAARLSAAFVRADDPLQLCTPFPGDSPVIGIFVPDMLNRNVTVFTAGGLCLGTVKTTYRKIQGKKRAVGRFVPSPGASGDMDPRVQAFLSTLTGDSGAFAEVMAAIDAKLNRTLPLSRNQFLFGRALVLAEAAVELSFFGGPEWSKKDADLGCFADLGLSEQEIPVRFGDVNRVTDGLCCGFYDGFSKGFPAFGGEGTDREYLSAAPFSIKSTDGVKRVTLLFDPMLKVTVSSGVLPVKQLELPGEHTDLSQYPLFSSELNLLLSEEQQAALPDFTGGASMVRYYPRLVGGNIVYQPLEITKPPVSIGEIGMTMLTDGVIAERNGTDERGK